jgi:pyridoxamine 5'-phosphate oxidase-like protein
MRPRLSSPRDLARGAPHGWGTLRGAKMGPMKWSEFAAQAPDLAALGAEGFGEQNLCLIGTLRADGWPRISPTEVYFVDGQMLLGMMPRSRKVLDLERDPRLTVATPQCDREAKRGDFKLYGRAMPVGDAGLRTRFADTQEAAIGWRPPDSIPLFAVEVESASYISFGEERRLLRWHPGGGVEQLPHPED